VRRLARRSAGADILARAQRLSDDLLLVEEDTFARNAEALTDVSPRIVRLATQHADPAKLLGDSKWKASVRRLVAAVAETGVEGANALLEATWLMSVESVRQELTLCEQTLAARYRGCADLGVGLALDALDDAVAAKQQYLEGAADYVLTSVSTLIGQQLGYATIRHEPADLFAARLVSPTPVNAPGCGGRGVLWRTVSAMNLAARTASIDLMNLARTTAMAGMNEACRGRR
jgi:hypothetical protein